MLNASHRLNARGDEHVHVPLDLCALGLGLPQRDLRLQPGQLQRDLLGDWELVTAHHAVHGLGEQEAHQSHLHRVSGNLPRALEQPLLEDESVVAGAGGFPLPVYRLLARGLILGGAGLALGGGLHGLVLLHLPRADDVVQVVVT